MTAIPDEAIEAASRAMSAHWRDMSTNMSLDRQRMLARHALTAAAPLIEAQVRETIADALEAIDSNDWAWRSMDVNTGTVVAQWIRDGLVLPPIGDDDDH